MERKIPDMRAVLRSTSLYCSVCGQLLYAGHKTIRCMNKHCVNYQIRYDFPSLVLQPSSSRTIDHTSDT